MKSTNTSCSCGAVAFTVKGPPLLRAYCHCTICQKANQAPFADITLFRAADVDLPETPQLHYQSMKFPPVLQRGSCQSCNKIAVEYMTLFPIPKVVVVPSQNIQETNRIPQPCMHIFYDTRVKDVNDPLPKHSGYLKSQFAFMRKLLSEMRHR